jgi:hypothetical protein
MTLPSKLKLKAVQNKFNEYIYIYIYIYKTRYSNKLFDQHFLSHGNQAYTN